MNQNEGPNHWQCPNCGSALPYAGAYCPNCGKSRRSSGMGVAFLILFIIIGIPAGLFGACCLLFAVGQPGGFDGGLLALGLGGALIAISLLVLTIRGFMQR